MGREETVVRVDLRRQMPPLQAQLVYRFHPPPFAMLVGLLCFLPFEAQSPVHAATHSVTLNQPDVPEGCLHTDHRMGTGEAPKPFVNIFPQHFCLLLCVTSHPAEGPWLLYPLL